MCDERSIAAALNTALPAPVNAVVCRSGTILGNRPLAAHQVQHLAWREGWTGNDEGDWLCPGCQADAKCEAAEHYED